MVFIFTIFNIEKGPATGLSQLQMYISYVNIPMMFKPLRLNDVYTHQ